MYIKRLKILIVLFAVLLAAMAVRIGYLQIGQGDYYRQRAEALLQHVELVPTVRGTIYDRKGLVLAQDRGCFELCLDYRFMTSSPRWIRRTQAAIRRNEGVDADEAKEIFDRRVENAWRLVEKVGGKGREDVKRTTVADVVRRIEIIRRRVGMDIREQRQAHAIVKNLPHVVSESDLADTVGVSVRKSHERVYPRGEAACHVIGMTGEVSKQEQDRLNLPTDGEGQWLEAVRSNYLPGDPIGKSGVEKLCEAHLRGRRGYERWRSRGTEPMAKGPFEPGKNAVLTIDIALQERIAALVSATGRNGCAVLLSVPRGEVLSLVSLPTFDLNRYRADYNKLAADVVNQPFKHRAVGERYPPGSTMKPITAVAALTDGTINESTTHACTGSLFSNPAKGFRCWIVGRGSHGPLVVVDALMNSCNIFFYKVGEAMGIARLGYWAKQFGYSQRAGTGLPEEVVGTVPTDGTPGEARMLAIGQSRLGVTPLHVANAMATIARNGEYLSPMLVIEGGPEQTRRTVPGSAAGFAAARRGMYKVANAPKSMTAYKYFHGPGVRELDFEVCGKTGTAETSPRLVDTDGDGSRDFRQDGRMVWFAGFAPKDNPQVAFAVMLEYVPKGDGGGGENCAPIAREMLRICSELGYVKAGQTDGS